MFRRFSVTSLGRRMNPEVVRELSVKLKAEGRGGIDLCGTPENSSNKTLQLLLRTRPLRHATVLNEEAKAIISFRTSLDGEHALLLVTPPLDLGLGKIEVQRIAEMGMAALFGLCGDRFTERECGILVREHHDRSRLPSG
ncbi:hypothetical protein K438DRAFT_1749410 [Mycena galopus ATCC 62051]|nr:hypothetical protein K438DRAFT_1749410 [Mycena galopus ATCC 62051]